MASPLADLYQRYKTGTRRIEQWLSENANSNSSIHDILATHTDTCDHQAPTVKPTTKELIAVADSIVQSAISKGRPPADVASIIIILEDVISGRREYQVWHQQRIEVFDEAHIRETASHEHFVGVLGSILERLKTVENLGQKPKKSRQGRKRAGNGRKISKSIQVEEDTDRSEATVLRNIYAGLEVEDSVLSERMGGASLSEPIPESASPKTGVSIQLGRPEGDDNFALWCFLNDCRKIRLFLRSIWKDYYAGDLSIQVAAEVTEHGLCLIAKATDEFQADFPHLAYYEDIADHLEIRGQMKGCEVEAFSYDGGTRNGFSPSTTEAVGLLCVPAFVALHSFREMIEATVEDREDSFELRQTFDKCHAINKCIYDCFRGLSRIPDYFWDWIKERGRIDISTYSFVLKARYRVEKTDVKEIMYYQVNMDLMDEREDQIGEFIAVVIFRTHVVGMIRQFEGETQDADHSKDNDNLSGRQALRECIKEYTNYLFRTPEDDNLGSTEADKIPYMMQMLSQMPVLCGTSVWQMMKLHYIDALITCQENLAVMCVAHLYRASLEVGLLSTPWEDMEFVIDQVGPLDLGIPEKRGTSTPVILSARRFGMAFGVQAAEYSNALRQNRNKGPARVPLPLKKHVVQPEGLPMFRKAHSISAKLQRSRLRDLDLSVWESLDGSLQQMAHSVLADPEINVDTETRKQWEACRRLNATQLLDLLKHQLGSEELAFCFDMHAFSLDCTTIMGDIFGSLQPSIKNLRTERGLSSDFDMVELVDEILWDAVQWPASELAEGTMLGCISRALQEQIDREGSLYTDSGKQLAAKMRQGYDKAAFDKAREFIRPNEPNPQSPSAIAMTGGKLQFTFWNLSPEEKEEKAEFLASLARYDEEYAASENAAKQDANNPKEQ